MYKSESPLIEFGESNIFEEFYELIEKHRLNTSRKFSIESMYINLSAFDLSYQNFSSSNSPKSNSIVYRYLNHCLYCFLIPFRFNGFSDRPFFSAFNRFIQYSTLLLKYSDNVDNPQFYFRNISQNFPSLWKGPYIDVLNANEFNFNLHSVSQYDEYYPIFERAEVSIAKDFGIEVKGISFGYSKSLKIYTPAYEVLEVTYSYTSQDFEIGRKSYEMEIGFNISDDENDAQRLLQTLYLIITAISNISNVSVEIEHLEVGSLLGRVRVYMADLIAKEETKAILETTKETIIGLASGGSVSHVQTKKANAETKKIIKETEILDKDLRDKPSDYEAKLSNALDLEKKALENEQLEIKNAKDRLDIIERLSGLAAKGLLEADFVKIDINGFLFLMKDHGKVTTTSKGLDQIS